MGKKLKWTPPADAVAVEDNPVKWTPPQDAEPVMANGLTEEQDKQKSLAELTTPKKTGREAELESASAFVKPFVDFGKKAWSALTDMLPGGVAAGEAGMMRSKNAFEDKIVNEAYPSTSTPAGPVAPFVTDEMRKAAIENYSKKVGADSFQKEKQGFEGAIDTRKLGLLDYSRQQDKESAENTKGVIQDTKDIKDISTAASYVAGAMGNVIGLAPAMVVPIFPYLMEKGEAYKGGLSEIEKATGKSEEQILKEDLDKTARDNSDISGAVNTALEGLGTLSVFGKFIPKSLSVKLITKIFKSRFGGITAGAIGEGGTEAIQALNTKLAAKMSTGKYNDIFEAANDLTDQEIEEIKQEGFAGAVGGGGMSATSQLISKNENEPSIEPTTQEAPSNPVQRPEEAAQPTVVQPVQPSAQEVAKPVENINLAPDGKENKVDPEARGAQQEITGISQEDAENVTRGVQEASPTTEGAQRSERQLKKDQDQELEAYAKKTGTFIEDPKEAFGEKLAGGAEQDVYLSKNGDKVIKVNGLTNHGGWADFWDRLTLQKELFPSTAYKLIGFTKSGGRLSAISEQNRIIGTEVPRQELIQNLAEKGFYQIHPEGSPGQNQFYNPESGVRLSDVHSENVLKDADGNIQYIDPMLDRENPFVDEESQKYFNEQKAKYAEEIKPQSPSAIEGEKPISTTDGKVNQGGQGRQEGLLTPQEKGEVKKTSPVSNLVTEGIDDLKEIAKAEKATPLTDEQEKQAIEIAKKYNNEVKNPSKTGKEVVIANSFEESINIGKYGDKNAIRPGMAKSYKISKSGTPIDKIAQKASHSFDGSETSISPDDVWQFMVDHNSGPNTIYTPSGNPVLKDLSDQFTKIAGKGINRKTVKDFLSNMAEKYGSIDSVGSFVDKYYVDGVLDVEKVKKDIDNDPDFQENNQLSDYEFQLLTEDIYGQQEQGGELQPIPGNLDQQGGRQESKTGTEGGAIQAEFGDQTTSAEERVAEITSQPLTHVPGLNMGKGLVSGTYLSTEKDNRYEGTPQKATVKIKKPFVFKDENAIIPLRNKILQENKDKFTADDLENPFGELESIDDLNDAGIDKLAEMVRERLRTEGFDSVYLPSTETQEGELIVFDRENVDIEAGLQKVEEGSQELLGPYQLEALQRINKAQGDLLAAEKAYKAKKDTLAKSITEDQIDIFGNRKGDEGKLFQQGAADRDQVKKQLDKLQRRVDKARQELESAKSSLEKAIEADKNSLFKDEKTKKTTEGVPYLSNPSANYGTGNSSVQRKDSPSNGIGSSIKAVWNKFKNIQFTGTTRVTSAADVADIMRLLEDKSVEHSFAVHVDQDGNSHIQFLSLGVTAGTVVDAKLVLAGVTKFNSKKVYLVHNHPSGNLDPSQSDIVLTNKIKSGLQDIGVDLEHLIMDTYKKEYTIINGKNSKQYKRKDRQDGVPLETHIMDEQTILKVPQTQIKDSRDIATFVQQLQYTAMPKNAVILLNIKNQIVGNYVFQDGIDLKQLTQWIGESATVMSVVFYGNQNNTLQVNQATSTLKNLDVNVLDYIVTGSNSQSIQGYYKSMSDGTLREDQEKYGTNNVNNPDRKASIKNALLKIAKGLIQSKQATPDNVIEKLREYLKGKRFGVTAKEIDQSIKSFNRYDKEKLTEFAEFVKKEEGDQVTDKKGVQKVMQDVFGLSEEESQSTAEVYDAVLSAIANRQGTTLEEQYQKIKFSKADKELADALAQNPAVKYQISLFHSSPYLFDKFRLSEVGKGVGQQKLGYGLYFLDQEGPTRGYATYPFVSKILPQFFKKYKAGKIDVAERLAYDFGGDLAVYKNQLAKEGKKLFGASQATNELSQLESLEQEINKRGLGIFTYKASAHQGKSPDQYDYLDGNTPLTAKQVEKLANSGISVEGMTGQQAYDAIAKEIGGQKQASEFLLENGIDGITYSDEAMFVDKSRAKGSKVYVVFDDNAVSIEETIKFQRDAERVKGAMRDMMNGQAIIYALTNPDVSTPVHELAHIYENYLSAAERKDILEWSGQKEWNVETSENFARGFEQYLKDGQAPNSKLQQAFENFKKWLNDIYQNINPSKIELNAKMKGIYAQMTDVNASENKSQKQKPAPKSAESNQSIESSKKERTIAKRYLSDESVSDEVKQGLSQEGRYYIPTTNLTRQAEADAYIEEKGIDQSIADITDPNNGLSDQNRIFIGKTIYAQLKQEVKTSETPNAVRDKINRLVEEIAKLGTRAGQTVQAFANMFASDAEQVAYSLTKEYNKSRNEALDINKANVDDLISLILDKAPKEALQSLLGDPRIKAILDESKKSENLRQSKRKQFTQKVLNKLDEIEKQIDDSIKSGRVNLDFSMGLLPLTYKAAINTIRLAVKAGDSLADAVEKAINEVKQNNKDWDESDFRKQFSSDIKEERKADRKTLLEYLQGESFKDLAIGHYKTLNSKKQELQEALEKDLEPSEAKRLMDTLEKIVGEKRQKLIKQKFGSKLSLPKKKRLVKQMADKIKEFTDLGVLSDKKLRDAYLESIELPAISDQQSKKLEELVERAEAKPMGWQRFEAVQDIIRYHQQITPLSWGSVVESIWYANMLSGLSTHKVNFEANAVRTMAETFVSSVQSVIEYKNPKVAFKNISFQLKGLVEGYNRNLKEAANILKNGYYPVKSNKFEGFAGVKTSQASVLEVLNKKNPLSWWRYVGRLLTATDILFYGGLKHMRAHQLAFREAYSKNQNTFDKTTLAKANELIGRTSIQLNAAQTRAESEGLTGKQKNRRIYEIMEQSWSELNREDATSFAVKGTYNHEPEGVMGLLSSSISTLTTSVPIVKTVVPFTRVISNVVNDYLDYTPWGLVRAAKGGMGIPTKPSYSKFTAEELLREKIKAISGSMAMVTLYAMSQSEDDDEPLLEITADGTGSFKNNFELARTGWKEYTAKIKGTDIRFDYRNTQLAIPFAVIGYINDSRKYKKDEMNDTQIGLIVSGTFHFISDLSFLSGMSDFFQILSDDKNFGDKITKFAGRTIKTGLVPNAFTQVSRSIQEITNTPMKKGDSFYAQLFRDFPAMRDNFDTMYNTLGEPIVTETLYKFNPLKMSTMADEKEKDSYKLWELISSTGAYIGTPSKSTRIYDSLTGVDRALTPEEYNIYALQAAKYTKEMLLIDYDDLVTETDKRLIKDRIYQIKEMARERAKGELFESMY
jgi:hypothetical protein